MHACIFLNHCNLYTATLHRGARVPTMPVNLSLQAPSWWNSKIKGKISIVQQSDTTSSSISRSDMIASHNALGISQLSMVKINVQIPRLLHAMWYHFWVWTCKWCRMMWHNFCSSPTNHPWSLCSVQETKYNWGFSMKYPMAHWYTYQLGCFHPVWQHIPLWVWSRENPKQIYSDS